MTSMSNIQQELLRLYANDVSDETLREVKQVLARFFADRAASEMDRFVEQNGVSTERMIEWANEHERSENRTRH